MGPLYENLKKEIRWLSLSPFYRCYIVLFWVYFRYSKFGYLCTFNQKLKVWMLIKNFLAISNKKLLLLWVLNSKHAKKYQVIRFCSLLQMLHSIFLGYFILLSKSGYLCTFNQKCQSSYAQKKSYLSNQNGFHYAQIILRL